MSNIQKRKIWKIQTNLKYQKYKKKRMKYQNCKNINLAKLHKYINYQKIQNYELSKYKNVKKSRVHKYKIPNIQKHI